MAVFDGLRAILDTSPSAPTSSKVVQGETKFNYARAFHLGAPNRVNTASELLGHWRPQQLTVMPSGSTGNEGASLKE
jgi:hypothetical protein